MQMRTCVSILMAACLLPVGAGAAGLASAPLKGGAGGLICSCSNLTADQLVVHVVLIYQVGATSCNNLSLSSGGFPRDCSVTSTPPRICVVRRDDGKSFSTKDIACTLATLDGAGNVTAVVPVDKKLKN